MKKITKIALVWSRTCGARQLKPPRHGAPSAQLCRASAQQLATAIGFGGTVRGWERRRVGVWKSEIGVSR